MTQEPKFLKNWEIFKGLFFAKGGERSTSGFMLSLPKRPSSSIASTTENVEGLAPLLAKKIGFSKRTFQKPVSFDENLHVSHSYPIFNEDIFESYALSIHVIDENKLQLYFWKKKESIFDSKVTFIYEEYATSNMINMSIIPNLNIILRPFVDKTKIVRIPPKTEPLSQDFPQATTLTVRFQDNVVDTITKKLDNLYTQETDTDTEEITLSIKINITYHNFNFKLQKSTSDMYM